MDVRHFCHVVFGPFCKAVCLLLGIFSHDYSGKVSIGRKKSQRLARVMRFSLVRYVK
jgi:hypothetical protein